MKFNDEIAYNSSIIYNSPEEVQERYRLEWLQSISTIAKSQDVFVRANNRIYTISSELSMLEFFTEYNFPSGSLVEWWVRTYDSRNYAFADSEHNMFIV
jgi:hypothetical protein